MSSITEILNTQVPQKQNKTGMIVIISVVVILIAVLIYRYYSIKNKEND